MVNEWNKLTNGCVNASSVNMFKNRIDRYLITAGYTQMRKLFGLSISQWLPYPLAIWNSLFGMTILLNLVKYCMSLSVESFDEKHLRASVLDTYLAVRLQHDGAALGIV